MTSMTTTPGAHPSDAGRRANALAASTHGRGGGLPVSAGGRTERIFGVSSKSFNR